jgi:anti-sigma factor RsiW
MNVAAESRAALQRRVHVGAHQQMGLQAHQRQVARGGTLPAAQWRRAAQAAAGVFGAQRAGLVVFSNWMLFCFSSS